MKIKTKSGTRQKQRCAIFLAINLSVKLKLDKVFVNT